MRGARFFSLLLAMALSAPVASAANGPRADLPAGIVFPTNSRAVFDSPAPLATLDQGVGDLSLLFPRSNFPAVLGSYSLGSKDKGFGLGVDNDSGTTTGALGAAFGTSAFQLGLALSSTFDQWDPNLKVGFRFGSEDGLMGAVVLDDVLSYEGNWTLGVGYGGSRWLKFESDLAFAQPGVSTKINSAVGTVAFLFIPTQEFTLKLGTDYEVVPDLKFAQDGLNGGAIYWLSPSVGGYVLYKDALATWIVGIKIVH